MAAFTQGSNFLLAVDESTTIKNPKAKRTKTLVVFGKKAAYKRILTGSPVTKSPMDLYAQCGFMDKNCSDLTRTTRSKDGMPSPRRNAWDRTASFKLWATEP